MPKRTTQQNTGVIEFIFPTQGPVLACVLDAMPSLPDPIRPTHYTESEPPRRSPDNRVDNRSPFEAFLAASRGGFCLACQQGHYTIDLGFRVGDILTLWPSLDRFQGEWAIALATVCARYGCTYGFGAHWDEYRARNQFVISLSDGGDVQGFIGKDIHRYVPGLYWLNYFSHEYRARMLIDLESLAAKTVGRIRDVHGGSLLQLYDHPRDWSQHNARVEAAIDSTDNFFSIRRVPIPQNITQYDYLCGDAGGFDSRRWP